MLVQQQPHADKGNIKTARLPSCKNCVSLDELLMINVQPKLVVSAGAASASLIVTASIMSPCVFRGHKSHICFLSGARGSWTITLPTTNATLEHSAPRLRSQRDGRGTVAQTHTHTHREDNPWAHEEAAVGMAWVKTPHTRNSCPAGASVTSPGLGEDWGRARDKKKVRMTLNCRITGALFCI